MNKKVGIVTLGCRVNWYESVAIAELLSKQGFEIVTISTRGGVLDMEQLCAALDKKIFLASFMLVNNETGALYSLKEAFKDYFFGRFAPYLERACIRLATPAASSAPRMMW